MSDHYYLSLDSENTVIGAASSNVAQADGVHVDAEIYEAALIDVGTVKWQDGKLIPIAQSTKVPDQLSRVACLLHLLADGRLDDVEAWVAKQDRATQIVYEDNDGFNRNEPKLQEAFKALGYSPDKIDGFFVKASRI